MAALAVIFIAGSSLQVLQPFLPVKVTGPACEREFRQAPDDPRARRTGERFGGVAVVGSALGRLTSRSVLRMAEIGAIRERGKAKAKNYNGSR